jgi:hypothetical protein
MIPVPRLLAGLLTASLAIGCAIPFQRLPEPEWQTGPEPGKGLVYIMYAGQGWGGSFAYVFLEDASGEDRYIGTLFSRTHLAQQLEPGVHLFAVVGNTVDLMRVTVEAGKTYHGIVASYLAPNKPFGGNYGHYRFEPINDADDERLESWLETSAEVVPTDKGRHQGAGHLKRLKKMKPEYLPDWQAKEDPQHLYVPTPHPPR